MRATSLHIGPPRMSGRSVSEPHSSFASLRRHFIRILPPVTDSMLFLSQQKGRKGNICTKYVLDARVDLGTTGIRRYATD